jgi:general secretion pathway protein G
MSESSTTTARRRARGFTLIELLVTIAILGILGTIVIRNVWDHYEESKQITAKGKVDALDTQVQMYKRKNNVLPKDLSVLSEPDPRNNGNAYVESSDLTDPWGNPYEIVQGDREGQFEVVSWGANGQKDGFGVDLGLERDIGSKHLLNDTSEGN